ncbi:MAG: internalin N-terminal domain-containing protein [Peptostreptococcaceae bacterium]
MSIKYFNPNTNEWEKIASLLATAIKIMDTQNNFIGSDLETVLKEVAEGLNTKFDRVSLENGMLSFYSKDILKQQIQLTGFSGLDEIINDLNTVKTKLDTKIEDVTADVTDEGTTLNFIANGVIKKSIQVSGGDSIIPKLTSNFNKQYFATDEKIVVDYHLTSLKGGEFTAFLSVDSKVTNQTIKLGANKWEVGILEKGNHTLKIYVTDRDGIVSNELSFEVMVGALSLTSNFNETIDYELSSNIVLNYTLDYYNDSDIQISLKIDNNEKVEVKKRGAHSWNIGLLEKGTHKIEIIAYDGINYSNKLSYTIAVVDSSSVFVSTPSLNIEQSPDEKLTIPFRISSKLNTKFKAYCYVNNELKTTISAVLGVNYWDLGYLPTGNHQLKIRVVEERTGTEGNIVLIDIVVAVSDFTPIAKVQGSMALHFTAEGKSNNSDDKEIWLDKSGNNVTARLVNVNYKNNGWIEDKLVLNGDAYAEIDYAPFSNDAEGGLTIDILFQYENSGDINSRIVSCEEEIAPFKGFYVDTKNINLISSGEPSSTPVRELEEIRATMIINRMLGQSHLYINGVCCNNVILTTIDKFNHDSKIYLGCKNTESGIKTNFGISKIKEIIVYNRVLDHLEVLQNYMSSLSIPEQKLMVKKNENKTIPEMHINGNFDGMGADAQVPLNIIYYSKETNTHSFESPALVDWQGNSSLQYQVKNYNIDLLNDDGSSRKVNVKDEWVIQDSYHIKANMVDSSHAFNLGLAKVVQTVTDYKYPPMETNAMLRHSVDGFPILMYHNNEFHGVYTFNLKQHRSIFGQDKKNPDHWMYRAEENSAQGSASFRKWTDEEIEAEWEERHPKRDMGNFDQYPPYDPVTGEGGKHPDFRKMIKWVCESTNEEFKANAHQWLHLKSIIDYYILAYVFGAVDSLGKNMTFTSWNRGTEGHSIWWAQWYDMDTIIGFDNKGEFVHPADVPCPAMYNTRNSALWEKILTNFDTEIKSRYAELRRDKLTMTTIRQCFLEEITNLIGEKFYNMDNWKKYLPFEKGYIFMAKGNRVHHILRWLEERMLYVDTMMGYNAQTRDSIIIRNTMSGEFTIRLKTYSPQMVTVEFGGTMGTNQGIQTKKVSDKEWTDFTFTFDGEYQRDISISNAKHIMAIDGLDNKTLLMLDIQYAEKLVEVSCKNNPSLTQLNTKNCKYLRKIDCSNNVGLAGALDLNGCINLTDLNASNTSITGLDIANCRNLKNVNVSNTNIKTLVINDNIYLNTLNFNNCLQLTTLSVTGCMLLTDFTAQNSGLVNISFVDCDNIASFNVSNNPNLLSIRLTDMNKLTTLNTTGCTSLKEITASYCTQLSNLIVAGCLNLEKIDIAYSKVQNMNYAVYTKLKYLDVSGTLDTTLQIATQNTIETLKIADSKIVQLNYSALSSLKVLDISNTVIATVVGLNLTQMKTLNISKTQINTITINGNKTIEDLNIASTQITDLDISDCTNLKSLVLSTSTNRNNTLRTLNVSSTNLSVMDFVNDNSFLCDSLLVLNASNTKNMTKIVAPLSISVVNISNSKLLTVEWSSIFTVPNALLSVNNMANYTRVAVNDNILADGDVAKLKEGTLYIDGDNISIKVLDGILAGMIFQVNYIFSELPLSGLPIKNIFLDPTIAMYIKERLNKPSVDSNVTQLELDTITYFGRSPQFITNTDYKGYFADKTITTFRGINYLRNLEYFNIAGNKFRGEITLYFDKLKTLDYSFTDCPNITTVTSTKETNGITSMIATFKNCSLLNNVILVGTMDNVISAESVFENCINMSTIISAVTSSKLQNLDRAFYGCTSLDTLTLTSKLPSLISKVDTFKYCNLGTVTFHTDITLKTISELTLFRDITPKTRKINFSNLVNLETLDLAIENNRNDVIESLDISNTKIIKLDFVNDCITSKLNEIIANNTSKLVSLKAPIGINRVEFNNSLLLNPPNLDNGIPSILFTVNNLADYTRVKIDTVELSAENVAKLKEGTLQVVHNQKIEIMDGILQGLIFTTCIGVSIIELFKDSVFANHIATLTGKSNVYEIVNRQDLAQVTYIGKRPDDTGVGYFENKTVSTFEGLMYLRELEYINVSRCIFNKVDLSDNKKIKNLNSSFAYCISLKEVILPKDCVIETMIDTFLGCTNLTTVKIFETAPNLITMAGAFRNCTNFKGAYFPQIIQNLNKSTLLNGGLYRTFEGCDLTNVKFYGEETIINMNTLSIIDAVLTNSIELDLSKMILLTTAKLCVNNINNTKLTKLNISNTKLELLDLDSGENTIARNILTLIAENTPLTKLKTRNTIREIKITGSKGLTELVYDFEKAVNVPNILKLENGMANYMNLKINGVIVDNDTILAIKNATYEGMEDPSVIEVLDGCLQGTIINVRYFESLPDNGLPLNQIFIDVTLCNHVRERIGKSSNTDVVTYYDLDRVTWIGAQDMQLNTISYFTNKTVTTWKGVEHLRNLKRINLNGVKSEKFYYAYTGNTIEYFRASSSTFKIINISKLYNVVSLLYSFTYCSNLESVFLPTSMLNLTTMSGAFLDCAKLNRISFPTTAINLEDMKDTFNGCLALTSIKLPTHLNKVNTMQYTFFNCQSLKSIVLSTEMNLLENMSYTFADCKSLTNVILPLNLPKANNMNSVLLRCSALTTVELPQVLGEVITIDSMFRGCLAIQEIRMSALPKTTYLMRAFEGCTDLRRVKFVGLAPVLSEFSYCFEGARSIEEIDISGVQNITLSQLTGVNLARINKVVIDNNKKMTTLNMQSYPILKHLSAKSTALQTLLLPQTIQYLYIDYSVGLAGFNPSLYPNLIEFTSVGVDIATFKLRSNTFNLLTTNSTYGLLTNEDYNDYTELEINGYTCDEKIVSDVKLGTYNFEVGREYVIYVLNGKLAGCEFKIIKQ